MYDSLQRILESLPASKHNRGDESVDRGEVEDWGGWEGSEAKPGQHHGGPAGYD